MKRIRKGNDFPITWLIKRHGELEDLTKATNMQLLMYVAGGSAKEVLFEVENKNVLTVAVESEDIDRLGVHNLKLSYKIPNEQFKGGMQDCTVDRNAFEIVATSAEADPVQEVALTSDMAIIMRGPKPTFEDYTAEDIHILQQPSREAALLANAAARDAQAAAANANEKAAAATTAANNADSKATLANNAASNADEKATLANNAASNANEKAALANTAANNADSKAALANTAANNADSKATLAEDAAASANDQAFLASEKGNFAKEQGDYSKTQGDYAKAQGELINESFATFYGVERSRDVKDPSFAKIGNLLMHESLPIHNLIRGCKAGRDRKIVNFLDRNTWLLNADGTTSVLDGSDGLDVLNYYPDMYAILDGGTDTEIWAISTIPFSYKGIEATHIKSHLVAPDYCTVDRTTNESRCVASDDANLAGSGSGATAGGVGYPRTYTSRYNYEVYAENKGEKWNGWIYRDYLTLQAFMYIQYKTRNLKQFFPGIGQGWTSANWNAYNGYYPVIKVLEAHKNIEGNNMTGIYTKEFNFDNDGTPVNYSTGFGVYRGMILWGHLWKWISGIDYEVQSEEDGGQSNVYVQFNPDKIDKNRSDSSFEFMNSYQLMGQASRSGGWAKTTIPFAAQPATMGGGETTYGCFYFWNNIPNTGTIRRGVFFGAHLHHGSRCALGTSYSFSGGSLANAHIGGGFRADENKDKVEA